MEFKSYVALDTETTGLLQHDQILQLSMIYEDFSKPVQDLEKISFLVDNSNEIYQGPLDPIAISMNAWIYKEISKGHSNHTIYLTEQARSEFHKFIVDINSRTGRPITFAGKNVAEFDISALRHNRFIIPANEHLISHRVIDTGSLYLTDFGYVPTQNEINQFIGRKPTTHDALDDAADVICAIRSKLKVTI